MRLLREKEKNKKKERGIAGGWGSMRQRGQGGGGCGTCKEDKRTTSWSLQETQRMTRDQGGEIVQAGDQWDEINKAVQEADVHTHVCVGACMGCRLAAGGSRQQQGREVGRTGVGGRSQAQAHRETQRDLDSSIMSESQAAAMSPDCRVPAEPSLSPSPLFLSLPLFSLSFFGSGRTQ